MGGILRMAAARWILARVLGACECRPAGSLPRDVATALESELPGTYSYPFQRVGVRRARGGQSCQVAQAP
jgi:hypothetical protein